MDSRERFSDLDEVFRAAIRSLQSSIWTCLPGSITSFDPVMVMASVQPGVSGQIKSPDGTLTSVNFPVLTDVPVMFPRGGGATLTFPIRPGDECLIFFASRAVDGWTQSGGIQPPSDDRKHAMADAFVLAGPQSQAKRLTGISVSTTQLRSDDGATYVELDPAGKIVNVVAPGGFHVTAPTSTFSGLVTATTDVKVGTISLKSHVHGGVQAGAATSGVPQ